MLVVWCDRRGTCHLELSLIGNGIGQILGASFLDVLCSHKQRSVLEIASPDGCSYCFSDVVAKIFATSYFL